jgi:hypothetical protein
LGVALVFRWLVLPWSVVMPVKPLWPHAWHLLATAKSPEPLGQLVIAAAAFLCTAAWVVINPPRNRISPAPVIGGTGQRYS